MDPYTLMVGVAVTAVIGVVMMVIAKFGFGGESEYEQQIARQKEVLLQDDKSKTADKKKGKSDKKKQKGKAKSETTGQTSGSELEPDVGQDDADGNVVAAEEMPPHIEYDPDPVIIDDAQTQVPAAKPSKKAKKSAPLKPILHNPDEKSMIRSEDAAIAETVFSATAPPKDDLELKRSKAKKAGGKKDKHKPVVAHVEEPEPVVDDVIVPAAAVKSQSAAPEVAAPQQVVEEMVVARTEAVVSSAAPHVKKARAKGKAVSDLEDIIRIVQEAPLSKDQMQTLVESVIARMESEDSWTTKGAKPDPVAVLRKQLEEALSTAAEEQSNVLSAQAKIKELTSKWTAAEKQHSAAAAQLQELQKRMQHTYEQHQKEVQALTAAGYQDKQKVEQQIEIIGQLSEENQRLKQSVANTDEVAQMQNQIRTLTTDKQNLAKQASEADKAAEEAKHEVARSKDSQNVVELAKQELKKRCDELGQKLAQSENAVVQAQSKTTEAERNVKNLQDHVQSQLRDKDVELQTLREDMNKTKELQLHSATNGGSNGTANGVGPETANLEQRISDLGQTINEKEDQINNLHKQLSVARASQNDLNAFKQKSTEEANKCNELENQVTELQTQVQALKDKNNELKRKIWTLNDSLEKAESSSLSSAATERDVEEKLCTINELKDRNAKLLSQNNELQEKCESMNSLNSEVSSLMKQVKEAKVSLDDKDKVIAQLDKSLKEEERKVSSNKSEQEVEKLNGHLSNLLKDKHELEARVDELERESHSAPVISDSSSDSSIYKNALRQVDTMLDSLTVNVEKEHNKVTTVLKSKDEQLLSVQQRLEEAVKLLDKSNSSQKEADSAKVSELTRQLNESNQKRLELEKALEETSSNVKVEAAAMAASGGGDDSGTCV